jgi:hypothetical protein
MIRVTGKVSVGFEVSDLWSQRCRGAIWLELDAGARFIGSGDCYGRVVPNVSSQQFSDWSAAGRFKVPDSLPWKDVAPPPPLRQVKNGNWRQFVRSLRHDVVSTTLVGRFEHAERDRGCVKQDGERRFVLAGTGYGSLNTYQDRLVIVEVLSSAADKDRVWPAPPATPEAPQVVPLR